MCSYGQFNRSFWNTYPEMNTLKTKIVSSDDDSLRLASIHYTNIANPTFKILTLNPSGDLISSKDFSVNLSGVSGTNAYISGVFKKQGAYFLSLFTYSGSVERLSVLEFNAQTGQVLQQNNYPVDLRIGYCEAVLHNNEIIHYVVKTTGGLYRIGHPTNQLGQPVEHLVDNSITSSGTLSSIIMTRLSYQVIHFNGLELMANYSNNTMTYYSRDTPSQFTSHILGSATLGGISIQNESDTAFVVMNGYTYYRIKANHTISQTGTYSSLVSIANFHMLRDISGSYYRTVRASGNQVLIEKYNSNFQTIDQKPVPYIQIAPGLLCGNQQVFYGISDRTSADLLNDGSESTLYPVSIICFKDSLYAGDIQEYNFPITKESVLFNAGISDKLCNFSGQNYLGASWNGRQSLISTFTQIHVARLSNGDTVGKNNDPYHSQTRVGPYTTPAAYNDILESKFNRGFYVTRSMIEQHIDSVQSNSTTYIAPLGIRNWPGNGDVSLGQASKLAGFIDLNNNGIYEPYSGEYPKIYGDNCFLQISHDHPNLSHPGGVENHTYIYSFDCDTADYLKNTLFFKTKYFLRTQHLQNFSTGIYIDMDNGSFADDYSGTHVELGMIYNFNGDLYDENWGAVPGFQDTLNATGVMILKGNKKDNDGIDNPNDASPIGCTNGLGFNDGIVDNEYYTLERSFSYSASGNITDPVSIYEWNNTANGFWSDGSPQFYGGTGNYNFGTTTSFKSRYSYPGGSDTLFYGTDGVYAGFDWTELTPNGPGTTSNAAQDRRMYAYLGSTNLSIGDSLETDMVFFVVNRPTNATDSLTSILSDLFSKGTKIKEAFNQNDAACGATFDPIESDLSVSKLEEITPLFYPNPSTGLYKITGLNGQQVEITIFDIEGKLVLQKSMTESDSIDLSKISGNVFYAKMQTAKSNSTFKLIKL
jgi:hypothetical protein